MLMKNFCYCNFWYCFIIWDFVFGLMGEWGLRVCGLMGWVCVMWRVKFKLGVGFDVLVIMGY